MGRVYEGNIYENIAGHCGAERAGQVNEAPRDVLGYLLAVLVWVK